jgi:hypothetical protein
VRGPVVACGARVVGVWIVGDEVRCVWGGGGACKSLAMTNKRSSAQRRAAACCLPAA